MDVHHTFTVLGTNEVVDTLDVNEVESKEGVALEIYFSHFKTLINHIIGLKEMRFSGNW